MKRAGFTLVEMLIALTIFGMLTAAGVALLTLTVRTQETSERLLGEVGELRRLGALMTADLGQAAPRTSRDGDGRPRPAFAGSALDAGCWCVRGGDRRAPLQRVEYRLNGDRLERLAYRAVDGDTRAVAIALLDNVRRLRLRYRDREGGWRERLGSDRRRPCCRARSSWSATPSPRLGAPALPGRGRAVKRPVPRRERGAALLAVLLLVAVTGAIAAAAMEGLRLSRAVAANATALDQARAFADGVEQLALLTLDDRIAESPERTTLDGGWNGAVRRVPMPGGALAEVRVRDGGNCFNLNSVVEGDPRRRSSAARRGWASSSA